MSNQELTLIAIVKAKAHKRDFVYEEILKLLAPTRSEEGCIQYVLHEDIKDNSRFVLYETWAKHELWQRHMETSHLKNFQEVTSDCLEEFSLLELTKQNV